VSTTLASAPQQTCTHDATNSQWTSQSVSPSLLQHCWLNIFWPTENRAINTQRFSSGTCGGRKLSRNWLTQVCLENGRYKGGGEVPSVGNMATWVVHAFHGLHHLASKMVQSKLSCCWCSCSDGECDAVDQHTNYHWRPCRHVGTALYTHTHTDAKQFDHMGMTSQWTTDKCNTKRWPTVMFTNTRLLVISGPLW